MIDREAREIIRLVASVRPPVCPFVCLFMQKHHDTWDTVQDLCVFVSNQGTFAIRTAVRGF